MLGGAIGESVCSTHVQTAETSAEYSCGGPSCGGAPSGKAYPFIPYPFIPLSLYPLLQYLQCPQQTSEIHRESFGIHWILMVLLPAIARPVSHMSVAWILSELFTILIKI